MKTITTLIMKNMMPLSPYLTSCLAFCLALTSPLAVAGESISAYSIADAISLEQSKSKLGSKVTFYFAEQPYGQVAKDFGMATSNQKTGAFNKSDLEACQWVFVAAMSALKERAIREGGNAVVEIQSNYKNNLVASNETFQCGADTFVAGAALIGKVVLLKPILKANPQ